jgi:hypothetical protein
VVDRGDQYRVNLATCSRETASTQAKSGWLSSSATPSDGQLTVTEGTRPSIHLWIVFEEVAQEQDYVECCWRSAVLTCSHRQLR